LVSIAYAESKRLIVLSLVCLDLLNDWNLMCRLIPKRSVSRQINPVSVMIMAVSEKMLKIQEMLVRLLIKILHRRSHQSKISFMWGQEGVKQLTAIVSQKGSVECIVYSLDLNVFFSVSTILRHPHRFTLAQPTEGATTLVTSWSAQKYVGAVQQLQLNKTIWSLKFLLILAGTAWEDNRADENSPRSRPWMQQGAF
jgi:hypothetical protein